MTTVTEPIPAATSGARPRHEVDFERPLVSLLGLPFDAVDTAQAVERIRTAALGHRRCFVSTPNLNFAMLALTDAAFRGSVLRSDLSLVDGMPLVWIARLLGVPVPERVSGADVFEALQAHGGAPVDVYLFGGPPGAAVLASEGINRRGGGVRCVGFDEGGFGSIESMSRDDQIGRINASGAHMVVAALGAGKGQRWLEHNAPRLAAPVLVHLGAVMNFAAGTVRRAPQWMQSVGLEWLWRIKEEPALWRRYWHDGVGAGGLLLGSVLPMAIAARTTGSRVSRVFRRAAPPRLVASRADLSHTLRLSGDWRADDALPALRTALAQAAQGRGHLVVDLAATTGLSSATTASLLVAKGWFEQHGGIEVVGPTRQIEAALRRSLSAEALLGVTQ